jgi:hypothetical protein
LLARSENGSVLPVDVAFEQRFLAAQLEYGSKGERVVGLAYKARRATHARTRTHTGCRCT